MTVIYMDPHKLTLKEVAQVIIDYNLETKLKGLMNEISRMNYEGYIKLSKPKNYYQKGDWQNILETLQANILEAKTKCEIEYLPEIIEKKLEKILQKNDIQGFKNFIRSFEQFLPPELVAEQENLNFLNWLFLNLQRRELKLYKNQIRLSEKANPENLLL